MHRLFVTLSLALCVLLPARPALAQDPAPPDPPAETETVDLFGFSLAQTERLKISGLLLAGWSHDGAQATLGFENQARVAQAIITFSGRVNSRVRYLVSFNPVNETSSKPACGEADFFFPNDPTFYVGGPNVPCDPETGHKRVDTYNTFALDYINQQGPLREGYVDWRVSDVIVGAVRPVHRADRVCSARGRLVDVEGPDTHPAPECRGEFRIDVRVLAAARRPVCAAVVRARRHGRPGRWQSPEGLRLVLLRRHVARQQQRAHRNRERPRPSASPRRSPDVIQEGLHRIQSRAAAQLLGLEAARRCVRGRREGAAAPERVGVWRIRPLRVGADRHVRRIAGRRSRADCEAGLLRGWHLRAAGRQVASRRVSRSRAKSSHATTAS